MADGYAQLASINAVLGGFAVTFLSVVLTHADTRKRAGVVLTIATICAACFFISAMGYALLAARVSELAPTAVDPRLSELHRPLSLLFITGIWCLFAILGAGGWLRSRALGVATSSVALVTAIIAWTVLRRFIR